MKLVEFPEATCTYAKDQPQYIPLPAHEFNDREGRIACCWQLSWAERLTLLVSGRLWQQMLTFGQPIAPQKLSVEKPAMRS